MCGLKGELLCVEKGGRKIMRRAPKATSPIKVETFFCSQEKFGLGEG